MINKTNANVYILKDGVIQFHYPDTSLVFELSGGSLYCFDRDEPLLDILKGEDCVRLIFEYLGVGYYYLFIEDFCDKDLYLSSNFDTTYLKLTSEVLKEIL